MYYLSENFKSLNILLMKIKGLIIIICLIALSLGSCSKSSIRNAKISTTEDTLSYAFGVANYNALMADSLDLNPIAMAKAMMDSKEGKAFMDDATARGFFMVYMNARQESQNRIMFQDIIVESEAFLAANKEKPGIIVTPSGLQYQVIKMGTGPKPTAEQTVKVLYTGSLVDSTIFDQNIDRTAPAELQVNSVIPAWSEALQLMPVGSVFKLYIPQDLAYGATGAGDVIPPFATLIFEVELLGIVN
jgi:FKBP-type peptidyl-prolyl cis-trans isomerase FklB